MIDLDLAGWRIRLKCEPDALAEAVAVRYAPFVVGDESVTPDMTARVTLMGHTAANDVAGARLILDGDVLRLDARGFSGRIGLGRGDATLVLNSVAPLGDVEYFARVLCALLAYRDGGLLVHAAGLMVSDGEGRPGQVSLFVGQSGSGKSTVVALSPQAVALNDDMILLRPHGVEWWAHGTPFWNAESANRAGQTAGGQVARILKLVQDTRDYLEPMSAAAATAELLAGCPIVNALPEYLPGLLGRCRKVSGAVPVQRLHFRKARTFWNLLGADISQDERLTSHL